MVSTYDRVIVGGVHPPANDDPRAVDIHVACRFFEGGWSVGVWGTITLTRNSRGEWIPYGKSPEDWVSKELLHYTREELFPREAEKFFIDIYRQGAEVAEARAITKETIAEVKEVYKEEI